MLRLNMMSKSKHFLNNATKYSSNINNDRITLINSVNDNLKKLSILLNTTDIEDFSENVLKQIVGYIISVREAFDNYKQLHGSEGINVFLDREYEIMFDRLLKMAIQIRATETVLNFSKNNVQMNLTGKNSDGTDVLPMNQRINQYIMYYFGTEASINNKLSTNVNNVYEPVRKTSNLELYKILRLVKFGDVLTKREYKWTTEMIERYRNILNYINEKYVVLKGHIQRIQNNMKKYGGR